MLSNQSHSCSLRTGQLHHFWGMTCTLLVFHGMFWLVMSFLSAFWSCLLMDFLLCVCVCTVYTRWGGHYSNSKGAPNDFKGASFNKREVQFEHIRCTYTGTVAVIQFRGCSPWKQHLKTFPSCVTRFWRKCPAENYGEHNWCSLPCSDNVSDSTWDANILLHDPTNGRNNVQLPQGQYQTGGLVNRRRGRVDFLLCKSNCFFNQVAVESCTSRVVHALSRSWNSCSLEWPFGRRDGSHCRLPTRWSLGLSLSLLRQFWHRLIRACKCEWLSVC